MSKLTAQMARAIISHTEDTKYSITEFIGLFARGTALSAVYTGGRYHRSLNATRVFGGYLSGALKIEPTRWGTLTDVFFHKTEDVAAVIATYGDDTDALLSALDDLAGVLADEQSTIYQTRVAEGKVHASAIESMAKARSKFVKAGVANDTNIKELEKEINALNSLLSELKANQKVLA